MGAVTNDLGLARDIPAEVKLAVRRRCRFCCVLCGAFPPQYHHFAPAYAAASGHHPEGITLLCGTCHDKVTRGIVSGEQVSDADARRQGGDLGQPAMVEFASPVATVVGTIVLLGDGPLITVGGTEVLRLDLSPDNIPLLSGSFSGRDGKESVIIEQNVLVALPHNWDVVLAGSVLTVQEGPRRIVVRVRFLPPHGLHVEFLSMRRENWEFRTDARTGEITITNAEGGGLHFPTDALLVCGGHIRLGDGAEMTGGVAIIPDYSATRFRQLLRNGDIEQILTDITPKR